MRRAVGEGAHLVDDPSPVLLCDVCEAVLCVAHEIVHHALDGLIPHLPAPRAESQAPPERPQSLFCTSYTDSHSDVNQCNMTPMSSIVFSSFVAYWYAGTPGMAVARL